jgi:hypothetical protein
MKVTTVGAARKDVGQNCIRCHKPIVIGESYRWAKGRFSHKRVIHAECGGFKASETTDNDKLVQAYSVQESMDEMEWTNFGDAKADVLTWVGEIEEVADMYRESAEAIRDGFGHDTSQSEEADEHAEEADDWAATVKDCLDDLSFEDDDASEEAEEEVRAALDSASQECPL